MLKIVFTSEDNENSIFGIEEFPISAEHASQLIVRRHVHGEIPER